MICAFLHQLCGIWFGGCSSVCSAADILPPQPTDFWNDMCSSPSIVWEHSYVIESNKLAKCTHEQWSVEGFFCWTFWKGVSLTLWQWKDLHIAIRVMSFIRQDVAWILCPRLLPVSGVWATVMGFDQGRNIDFNYRLSMKLREEERRETILSFSESLVSH